MLPATRAIRPALVVRAASLFLLASAAALAAAGASAAEPRSGRLADGREVLASAGPGGTVLTYRSGLDGREFPIHRTEGSVANQWLEAVDSAGVLYAGWHEGSPQAASAAGALHIAISKDGGVTWSRARRMRYEIPLKAGLLEPGVSAPSVPPNLRNGPSSGLSIVQFETLGIEPWRARLRELGADVLNPLPRNAHIVRMTPAVAAAVRRESFVRWVGPYHAGYRIERETLAEILDTSISRDTARRYRLQTFERGLAAKQRLAAEVEALGGAIVSMIPDGFILEANLTLDQVTAIAHSDHLLWLDRWTPYGYDMDLVRGQTGADFVESVAGYDGAGVRGEVMDGGIQISPFHQDHDGVLIHGGTPNVDSHGTRTYGMVFGNGNRDGDGDAKATGHLPAAQGYFADTGFLSNRYTHTQELVSPPINAVFQSNSWGSSRTTAYTSISSEMDDIIFLYDISIFQSQSNAGNQDSRPQAWAKNIVSVGAVDHEDTATLSDDSWANGNGSIGPAADGRIKPDLAFWYDWQYTTTSGGSGTSYTSTFGGTSAATPATAGVGGLIYQMWADNLWGTNPVGTTVFEKRPHSTTAKALMINTAEQYAFSGTTHDKTRMHQGWGMPSVRNAYDRAAMTQVVDETSVLEEFDFDTYFATVPASQTELKITMVYMDRAGTTSSTLHRINDVTLKVTAPDDVTVYWGNVGLDVGNWSTAGGAADTKNTVENVFIQNPMPGDWTIEVFADELNQDVHTETPEVDQDYALVVYGVTSLTDCRDTVGIPTGVTANAVEDNEIQVTWTGSVSAQEYEIWRSDAACGGPYTLVGTVSAPTTSFTDFTASGGIEYHYVVRSVESCTSRDSACASATATGECLLEPSFGGLNAASSDAGSTCAVNLSWDPAGPSCGGALRYNVYRSATSPFTPAVDNRIAFCLAGSSYADTSPLVPGQNYHYIVRAEDLGGRPDGPCGGIEETNEVTFTALAETVTVLMDHRFETGLEGWSPSTGSPAASTGGFIAGDPVGTFNGGDPAQPEDDHGAAGTGCLYTGANPGGSIGTDDVDNGEVQAFSPVFDGSSFAGSRIRLWRWHYNRDLGEDAGDYFALDVSNDGGGNWTNMETLDTNVRANAWTEVEFDLGSFVTLTSNMRVRVRSADGTATGNIIESAIDDFVTEGTDACSGASGPPGVLTGAPGALMASLEGGMVRLSWGADCGATTGFGIYRGDLATGYASLAPVAGQCDLTSRTADLAPDTGSYFYLVIPNDGIEEGSAGTDGLGIDRPQAGTACHPRAAGLDACAP